MKRINSAITGLFAGFVLALAPFWIFVAQDLIGESWLDRHGKGLPEQQWNALYESYGSFWLKIAVAGRCCRWLGFVLILVCAVFLIRARISARHTSGIVQRRPLAGILAIGSAALFNLAVLATCIPFLFVPRGQGIRPMGWASFMFEIAGVTLMVVLPLSFMSLFLGEKRRLGGWAIVLSLLPLPLSMMLLHGFAALCGFELEP